MQRSSARIATIKQQKAIADREKAAAEALAAAAASTSAVKKRSRSKKSAQLTQPKNKVTKPAVSKKKTAKPAISSKTPAKGATKVPGKAAPAPQKGRSKRKAMKEEDPDTSMAVDEDSPPTFVAEEDPPPNTEEEPAQSIEGDDELPPDVDEEPTQDADSSPDSFHSSVQEQPARPVTSEGYTIEWEGPGSDWRDPEGTSDWSSPDLGSPLPPRTNAPPPPASRPLPPLPIGANHPARASEPPSVPSASWTNNKRKTRAEDDDAADAGETSPSAAKRARTQTAPTAAHKNPFEPTAALDAFWTAARQFDPVEHARLAADLRRFQTSELFVPVVTSLLGAAVRSAFFEPAFLRGMATDMADRLMPAMQAQWEGPMARRMVEGLMPAVQAQWEEGMARMGMVARGGEGEGVRREGDVVMPDGEEELGKEKEAGEGGEEPGVEE